MGMPTEKFVDNAI